MYPKKYETKEQLDDAINQYFELLDIEDKGEFKRYHRDSTPTVTGLALFLGFESRQSIYDYKNKGDELSYSIKMALLAIENFYEQNLVQGSPTGSIFALKNFGWQDKTQQEQTQEVTVRFMENDE